MIDDPTTISTGPSAADSAWFTHAATLIVLGAMLLGGLRGLQSLLVFMATPAPGFTAIVAAFVGAFSEVVVYGLIGLTASAAVRALGVWTASAAQGRSPANEASIETSAPTMSSTDVGAQSGAAVQLAEIRRLIHDHEWDSATDAARSFRDQHPVDPRGVEASEELEQTMQAALGRLEAQLQAAREVNDPDQVLEIHGRMSPLLKEETRKHLDVDLSHWFLMIVHRRLRSGRIQADVVELADRIAEIFGHTIDGASLRASLPTLRRSAGLCPRCAKPYTGSAKACPECLKTAPAPPLNFEPDELDEPPFKPSEPDVFLEPSDESTG